MSRVRAIAVIGFCNAIVWLCGIGLRLLGVRGVVHTLKAAKHV